MLASLTAPNTSVVKAKRPAATLRLIPSSIPTSATGELPVFSISIFFESMSAHVTEWPNSDSPTPVESPTYPVPTIVVFILMHCIPPNTLFDDATDTMLETGEKTPTSNL